MLVTYQPKSFIKDIEMPGSKSISNRLLLLQDLYFPNMVIDNLSKSSDSESLKSLILENNNGSTSFHVHDGGTTFRFMLCLLAISNRKVSITCGETLFNRPHDALINTLTSIGFDIAPILNGYTINPVSLSNLQTEWSISVEQSSQFASALLMIAPNIGKRITLNLIGQPVSKGYFDLTVGLMHDLGITIEHLKNKLIIEPFKKNQKTMVATVEADWSAVSYFIALSRLTNQQLRIHNVNQQSLQPDQDILTFAGYIGVDYTFDSTTLVLSPIESFDYPPSLNRDYTNCPDIALSEIVLCYALNIDLNAKGIDHLKFKESNRAIVIHDELSNFSSDVPSFNTHNDHRVAMSLTTLSILKPIEFDDINVVSKSFPDFWQEVSKLGINLTQ